MTGREANFAVTPLEAAARDAMEILGGMPAGKVAWDEQNQIGRNVGQVYAALKMELDALDDDRSNREALHV